MDALYLSNPKAYNEDQAMTMVKTYLPLLTDLQAYEQAARLKMKAEKLENTYFQWYFTWIAFSLGFIGWFAPNVSLRMRRSIVVIEAEEDFLQLQTLVSILMNTNIDTMEMLYQLSRSSRVHSDMFAVAFHSYPSNPEMSIVRLQTKTPIYEFKRFIGKLKLTISELSMGEAFESLLLEREHIMKMREMSTKVSIDKKRSTAGKLALAPLVVVVLGEFLFPIGYLGVVELMNAFKNMG